MPLTPTRLLLTTALSIALAGGLAACGSDGREGDAAGAGSSATATSPAVDPKDVDRAFVRQMIPHHELAVDMAEIAADEAQHAEVKKLAAAVVTAQNAEIDQLKDQAEVLGVADYDAPETMTDDAAVLGLPMGQMGMDMNASALKDADPFDQAFIDAMLPHHAGAIAMAKAELAGGANPRLKRLATAIIAAQERESAEMTSWRQDWYGDAPASNPTEHDMDHGDMPGE